MTVDGKLEEVERRLKEKTRELAETPKDTAVKLKADIDKLSLNKDKLHKQKTTIDGKLLEGKILSPQEERRSVSALPPFPNTPCYVYSQIPFNKIVFLQQKLC